jgi:hypothetical protein
MRAHVQCTSAKKVVSSNIVKTLKVATKIRETCEKTLFTPSSPVKATKLYRFCLSDKRSSKLPINIKRKNITEIAFAFLAISDCQKVSLV